MAKYSSLQLQSLTDINCLLQEIDECLNGFLSRISEYKDIAQPEDYARLVEYEDEVQKLKSKKERLEVLRDKYIQLENTRNASMSKKLKQENLELDSLLLERSKSLGLPDSSEDTQSAFSTMDAYLLDRENQLKDTLRRKAEENSKKINHEEALLTSLMALSHFRLIQSDEQLMTVEMQSLKQAVSRDQSQENSELHGSASELSKPLRVTISFDEKRSIAGIQVTVPTLEVKDLLHEAQKSNDVNLLLLSVYQRWTKYFRLLEEIEPLRHRYAIDWLYSEGIVRVLCGSQSQITCTLKLHADYPTVPSVTLTSATGLPPDFNLDAVQMPANATLGQSLEFLHSRLNFPATEQNSICT